MMKQVLVLAVLFCAAFAAPTEEKDLKAVVAAEDAPEEQVVAEEEDAVAEAPEDAAAQLSFCPSGWFFHGSRCYKFVHSSMNWFNAEEHCNSLGAHLASASSASEYSYLQQLTETAQHSFAWIGGFYLQGQWLWIDRQGMYYQNWYNKNSAVTSNSCVYLRSSTGWRNSCCTTTWPSICSRSPFSC